MWSAARSAKISMILCMPERVSGGDAKFQGFCDGWNKWEGQCKRHALVDTDGRGLVLEAHPASIQDRDGGGPLLCASRGSFPFIEKVFADSGYAGEKVATATVIAVEIVRKSPDQVGFAVHPRRWVVERFFAWINRNRRLAKDFEATIASARAFLYAASVMLLVRRLARAACLSKPTLRVSSSSNCAAPWFSMSRGSIRIASVFANVLSTRPPDYCLALLTFDASTGHDNRVRTCTA